MNLEPKFTLYALRETGVTPLEAIRAKNHSPAELRRQAALMRRYFHSGFADLLEDEADCRETVLRRDLNARLTASTVEGALQTALEYPRNTVRLETRHGFAYCTCTGDRFTVERRGVMRHMMTQDDVRLVLRDLERP